MSSANAIHLKRLKRKRTLTRRLKAYGSVFNHFTFFGKPKQKVFPTIMTIEHRTKRVGLIRRFINWVKSFFV